MDAPEDRDRVERARAALAADLDARTPGLDPRTRAEIEAEAAPVVAATIGAASGNAADGHEAVALAALFGRRIAALGQSPTTALAAIDAVDHAVAGSGARPATPDVTRLRAAAMEGFAAAVDERARTEMIERAGQSLTPMIVSPRVVLLVIAGCEDADTIAQALARLGRVALDSDAKACIVHSSFARAPDRDVVAEVAAFDGSAQMIGARAIFSGTPLALSALQEHGPALSFANTFEDALRRALDAAEQEVRPASLLSRSLKRLRG